MKCKIDGSYNMKDTTAAMTSVTFYELALDVLKQDCNFKVKFILFTIIA